MFDIGASELLVIVIIAIIVIGPKELPLALRTAGRWIGKIRRVSSHFRTGLDAMVREAELEEMDRKWKEQNDAIMRKYPATDNEASALGHNDEMTPLEAAPATPVADPDPENAVAKPVDPEPPVDEGDDEPSLPLESPKKGS